MMIDQFSVVDEKLPLNVRIGKPFKAESRQTIWAIIRNLTASKSFLPLLNNR
jgi:hypothetical protein